MLMTSTSLILRPTTSRSRSRRNVSTSGSSGTHGLGSVVSFVSFISFVVQVVPRLSGGGLFGCLLGSALTVSVRGAGDEDRRREPLGVVGPLVDDVVTRQVFELAGGKLLEPRLVVVSARAGRGLGDALVEQLGDQLFGRPEPGVEIDGADHRLHGVREDRRLLSAAGLLLA